MLEARAPAATLDPAPSPRAGVLRAVPALDRGSDRVSSRGGVMAPARGVRPAAAATKAATKVLELDLLVATAYWRRGDMLPSAAL